MSNMRPSLQFLTDHWRRVSPSGSKLRAHSHRAASAPPFTNRMRTCTRKSSTNTSKGEPNSNSSNKTAALDSESGAGAGSSQPPPPAGEKTFGEKMRPVLIFGMGLYLGLSFMGTRTIDDKDGTKRKPEGSAFLKQLKADFDRTSGVGGVGMPQHEHESSYDSDSKR